LAFVLSIVGGFGPLLAGVYLVDKIADKENQREFLWRVVSFRRIGGVWYAVILLFFPVVVTLSLLLDLAMGGNAPSFLVLESIAAQPLQLLNLPLIVIQVLIVGPLPEEPGWRGYALDELQTKWNALVASLFLGLMWAVWHLPLFFFEGSMYHDWGFGTGLFWLFVARMMALSIVMTWIYNNNRRSILSAILFHFMFNFTFVFVTPVPATLHLYGTMLIALIAASIAFIWGPSTLVRQSYKA
jgi:membrane protease YdiL (CAAX protease family)